MSIQQQLGMYLQDAHAIELQALQQIRRARKVAGDPEIAAAFSEHLPETKRHERFVKARLAALSWSTVPQKDLAGKLTGMGMAWFARVQPDTPGKLVAHAYAYERMELAAYELLARLAARAGDRETALDARRISSDERAMAERLASLFERAADASLPERDSGQLGHQLNKYLADAHAIEQQAEKFLQKAPQLLEAGPLAHVFEDHLEQTRRHAQLIEQRLEARDARPSALKDAALQAGALSLGMLLKAQVDVPAKLTAFAYAFEHLEVAAYALLHWVATRAQDEDTVLAVDEILLQERAMAARLFDRFDVALDSSLEVASVVDDLSGAGHAEPAQAS